MFQTNALREPNQLDFSKICYQAELLISPHLVNLYTCL